MPGPKGYPGGCKPFAFLARQQASCRLLLGQSGVATFAGGGSSRRVTGSSGAIPPLSRFLAQT